MRSLFFLLLATGFMATTANAQKLTDDKIPAAVVAAFKLAFQGVSAPVWEMEKPNEYEANFKRNGMEVSACFDQSGKWLETESEIKVSEVPAKVLRALGENFAGGHIAETNKVERPDRGITYSAEVKKETEVFDVLLNPDGTIVSKSLKGSDEPEKD